jgi:hypothetical protein
VEGERDQQSVAVSRPVPLPFAFVAFALYLCNLADPEDRSNQASPATLGGFWNHLSHLFSSTEEEECRLIQASIMTPADSSMSFVEMAIGYA